MKGYIVAFRGSKNTKYERQMIIEVDEINNADEAEEITGNEVEWQNPEGENITGEISSAHGDNGALRAIFTKGMPGQSLGTTVEIKE